MEGLLEHPAQFERYGADIHGKSVDLFGRGPPADPTLVVDDEGMKPRMGKPRGGAKPPGAGPNHDGIHALLSHKSTSPSAAGWSRACVWLARTGERYYNPTGRSNYFLWIKPVWPAGWLPRINRNFSCGIIILEVTNPRSRSGLSSRRERSREAGMART